MNKIKKPVQKRAVEKKKKLVESAKKVFNEKGYYSTNIKDITSEAGASVGLFYKYFTDKTDIYLEALESLVEEEMKIVFEFREKIINEEDKREVIKKYIFSRLETIKYNSILNEFHILIKSEEDMKDTLGKAKEEYLKIIQGILTSLWQGATERKLEVGAMMMWRTVQSNIIEINNLDDSELKSEYVENLIDLVYRYIEFNRQFEGD